MTRRFDFLNDVGQALQYRADIRPVLLKHAANPDFRAFVKESLRALGCLDLTFNDCPIATIPLHQGMAVTPDIKPGFYTLRLSTGLSLWEKSLTKSDVMLADAFPKQPMLLAASTENMNDSCTHDLPLLNGSIHLKVIPGPTCGTITIGLTP